MEEAREGVLTSAFQLDDGNDSPPPFDAHDDEVLRGSLHLAAPRLREGESEYTRASASEEDKRLVYITLMPMFESLVSLINI